MDYTRTCIKYLVSLEANLLDILLLPLNRLRKVRKAYQRKKFDDGEFMDDRNHR